MKGYLIMSDFKDIDLSKFSLDLTKTMQYVNPVQDQMARIQREQEQTIRSIQKAREEKEAEELRRHNSRCLERSWRKRSNNSHRR